MNPETQTTDLTEEQLEAMLAKKRKEKAAAAKREADKYIADRDHTIGMIMTNVVDLHESLARFKALCHDRMEEQSEKLASYGKLRSNSKGGFSITTEDGQLRVTRRRDTEPSWDERAEKAVGLIKDFLGDTIKKRDIDTYEVLMTFVERNENGDLEYSRVMDLFKHESRFTDDRWTEGLRLIKESYSNHLKGYGYEFKRKGADGKWENILLNFSSL